MRVSDVIRDKGSAVVTVEPETNGRTLLDLLTQHRIGAVVVLSDGDTIDGIVWEGDLVRALSERGATVFSEPARRVMSPDIATCSMDTDIDEVMTIMTEGRFRHLPVLVDGHLAGVVSIGDIVRYRVGELELEAEALSKYITSSVT